MTDINQLNLPEPRLLAPGRLMWLAQMVRAIVESMRPHQWVKNSFVLAPLVFSRSLADAGLVARAALAALIFSLVSGAVYIINDLMDREEDRQHPAKCNRPIASGRLPVGVARWVPAGIFTLALSSAVVLGLPFVLTLSVYFSFNLAYSYRLKHVPFLDVSIIGLGFLLRVLAGAFAIAVPISVWLIVCTFLLALFLGLGKRKHELVSMGGGQKTRRVLESYQLHHVKLAMGLAASVTAVCYTLYTLDTVTVAQLGTAWLPVTIPFIIFGLHRFFTLTQRFDHPESPTEQMIKDVPFLANVLVWGIVVLMLLYV